MRSVLSNVSGIVRIEDRNLRSELLLEEPHISFGTQSETSDVRVNLREITSIITSSDWYEKTDKIGGNNGLIHLIPFGSYTYNDKWFTESKDGRKPCSVVNVTKNFLEIRHKVFTTSSTYKSEEMIKHFIVNRIFSDNLKRDHIDTTIKDVEIKVKIIQEKIYQNNIIPDDPIWTPIEKTYPLDQYKSVIWYSQFNRGDIDDTYGILRRVNLYLLVETTCEAVAMFEWTKNIQFSRSSQLYKVARCLEVWKRLTTQQIVNGTGIKKTSVSAILGGLSKKNVVKKIDGKWQIISIEPLNLKPLSELTIKVTTERARQFNNEQVSKQQIAIDRTTNYSSATY